MVASWPRPPQRERAHLSHRETHCREQRSGTADATNDGPPVGQAHPAMTVPLSSLARWRELALAEAAGVRRRSRIGPPLPEVAGKAGWRKAFGPGVQVAELARPAVWRLDGPRPDRAPVVSCTPGRGPHRAAPITVADQHGGGGPCVPSIPCRLPSRGRVRDGRRVLRRPGPGALVPGRVPSVRRRSPPRGRGRVGRWALGLPDRGGTALGQRSGVHARALSPAADSVRLGDGPERTLASHHVGSSAGLAGRLLRARPPEHRCSVRCRAALPG